MLMTHLDIEQALQEKALVISNFDKHYLKPIAYTARIGNRVLVGGQEQEVDLSSVGTITIKAGDFMMFNTIECFTLSGKITGRIGMRSHWARKGLILLAGMHIDPLWDGHLILGAYNASPNDISIDYMVDILAIEFHQLNVAPTLTAKNNPDQKAGRIPSIDKEFIRRMETQSLSELGRDVRHLTQSVARIEEEIIIMVQSIKDINEGLNNRMDKQNEDFNNRMDKQFNKFMVVLAIGIAFLSTFAIFK